MVSARMRVVCAANKQSYYLDADKLIYAAGGNQDSRREPQWKGKDTFTGKVCSNDPCLRQMFLIVHLRGLVGRPRSVFIESPA